MKLLHKVPHAMITWMGCLFLTLSSSPGAFSQGFSMGKLIGVNLLREDPTDRLSCAGFVREYHDWDIDEGLNSSDYSFANEVISDLGDAGNLFTWVQLPDNTPVTIMNDPFTGGLPQCGFFMKSNNGFTNGSVRGSLSNGQQTINKQTQMIRARISSKNLASNFNVRLVLTDASGGTITSGEVVVSNQISNTNWVNCDFRFGDQCTGAPVDFVFTKMELQFSIAGIFLFDLFARRDLPEIYPFNKMRVNPSYGGRTTEKNFDAFYEKLVGTDGGGRGLCITTTGTLKTLYDEYKKYKPNFGCDLHAGALPILKTDANGNFLPITIADETTPESYVWHADYITQFANYYGGVNVLTATERKLGAGQPDGYSHEGSNGFYLENWNENDKWWCTDPSSYQFSPAAYATMSSMDFDGNGGTVNGLTATCPPAGYAAGHFGLQGKGFKYVMGGLTDIESNGQTDPQAYVQDMYTQFKSLRADDKFVFDVLNFHHYRFSDFGIESSYGVEPEAITNGKTLYQKLFDLRNNLTAQQNGSYSPFGNPNALPGAADYKEYWLSEFGYDTNPFSDVAALPLKDMVNLPGVNMRNNALTLRNGWTGYSNDIKEEVNNAMQECQAMWIVRTFYQVRRAKWDKAIQYYMKDDLDMVDFNYYSNGTLQSPSYGVNGFRFKNCGLLLGKDSNYNPKRSWYYVNTTRDVLDGTDYVSDVSPGNFSVYKYSDGTKNVYAVWRPTSNFFTDAEIGDPQEDFQPGSPHPNPSNAYTLAKMSEIIPGLTGEATIIDLEAPYPLGNRWSWKVADHANEQFKVRERPFYIVDQPYVKSSLSCSQYGLEVLSQSCDHVKIVASTHQGFDVLGYFWVVFYAEKDKVNNPDNPRFEELTLFRDDIPAHFKDFVVTGLEECKSYYIYIRLMGPGGNLSSWCRLEAQPNACDCYMNGNALKNLLTYPSGAIVYPPSVCNGGECSPDILFDYDNVSCDFLSTDPTGYWFDYTPAIENQFILTFGGNKEIDAIYLYDVNDTGNFTVEYDTDGSGNDWLPLISYETRAYNEWVTFSNFSLWSCCIVAQPKSTIRRLRFTKDASGNIGRVVICEGVPSNIYPPDRNTRVTNLTVSSPAPDRAQVNWTTVLQNINAPSLGYAPVYRISYSNAEDVNGNLVNPKTITVTSNPVLTSLSTTIQDPIFVTGGPKVHINQCICLAEQHIPDTERDNDQPGPDWPLQVVPNPTTGMLRVLVKSTGTKQMRLFDLKGRQLNDWMLADGQSETALDLSSYAQGVYIIVVESADGVTERARLVKL